MRVRRLGNSEEGDGGHRENQAISSRTQRKYGTRVNLLPQVLVDLVDISEGRAVVGPGDTTEMHSRIAIEGPAVG